LYIIVGHTMEILICCISTIEKRVKECAINWRVVI